MSKVKSYQELRKLGLRSTEKIIRYKHHIVFNLTYVKLNAVPKGFKLRHHSNIVECDSEPVLKRCSKKLMLKRSSVIRIN